MWGTAAIGMAVGAGMYWLGLFEAAVLVAIQIILHRFPVGADALTTQEILVELEDTDELRARFDDLLKEHRGQVTESSLTRQDGCLRMEITVRLEPPITHDEALAFMRENPGVKECLYKRRMKSRPPGRLFHAQLRFRWSLLYSV